MNSCHTHFPERVGDLKRQFYVGGFPYRTANNITWRVVNEAYRDGVPETKLVV